MFVVGRLEDSRVFLDVYLGEVSEFTTERTRILQGLFDDLLLNYPWRVTNTH